MTLESKSTVHMEYKNMRFMLEKVTLQRFDSIAYIDDTDTPHFLYFNFYRIAVSSVLNSKSSQCYFSLSVTMAHSYETLPTRESLLKLGLDH